MEVAFVLRAISQRPNKSFKPKPLRYANHMAGKACHVLRSTARLGLTLALEQEIVIERNSVSLYFSEVGQVLTE